VFANIWMGMKFSAHISPMMKVFSKSLARDGRLLQKIGQGWSVLSTI
jgi:hypothetical protein